MEYICQKCNKSFAKAKAYTNHRRWCSGLLTRKKYPTRKKCRLCKKEKGIARFRKLFNKRVNRPYPDPYCKKCNVIKTVEYHKNHPEWSKKSLRECYFSWKKRIIGESCLICGENRVLDLAHIIPRNGKNGKSRLAWWNQSWNVLGVCPNHHRMFDKKKLRNDEYIKIKEKVENAKIQYHNSSFCR